MSLSPSPFLKPSRSPSPQLPAQPDHFYGSEDIQLPPSPNSDGRTWLTPEDDPLAHRGIPVFKPTMEEFQDFEQYVTRIEGWGMRSGIVKIIPPKEWTDTLPPLKDQLSSVKIQRPIEQHMLGRGGLFRQENIEKRKFMSVREWAELCAKEDFRAPSVGEVGVHGRGANTRAKTTRTKTGRRNNAARGASVKTGTNGSTSIKQEIDEDDGAMDVEGSNTSNPIVVTPADPPLSPASQNADLPPETVDEASDDKPKAKRRRVGKKAEEKHAEAAAKQAQDTDFLSNFDPHKDWLPSDTNATDYTREFCQELERKYWRNLGLGKPAWYGADSAGSLFTEQTQSWNVAHLTSTLTRLLPADNQGLPGVNTPYLYFGMWRATFAWHVEDMDLFSINYIHFGAPKFWYAIPQGRANALEQTMRSYFPKDTSHCPQFLRHKSFLASPTLLAQSSVRPNYLVQQAGEFVITFPRGYHAGFNLGFNCAESVNFALDSWLELGRRAKACQCINDSVRIDVDQLLQDRAADMAAEEMEEALPEPVEPPKSKRSPKKVIQPNVKIEDRQPSGKHPKSPKKRKADVVDDEQPSKKLKIKLSSLKHSPPTSDTPLKAPTGKVSLTLKITPKPAEQPFPCCLCVSMNKEGLLRVHEPPTSRKDAVDAAGNPKQWLAHEYCARVVPETWVDEIENGVNGAKEKFVFGVDGIVKDRWNLKCSVCTKNRSKAHGAPIQCTKGKCPKAFHVSCARECLNGVLFSETREVEKEVVLLEPSTTSVPTGTEATSLGLDTPAHAQPTSSDNRTTPDRATSSLSDSTVLKVIKKLEVQVLCSQHNPAIAAAKKANKMDRIKADLLSLPTMARIKIRVSSGVFEVSLIRVIEETCSVEVLWDRGTKREFKWGSVVFGSTEGPVLQKPSAFIPEITQAGLPVQTYTTLAAAASNPNPAVASSSTQPEGSANPTYPNGGAASAYEYWNNYAKAYGYSGYYPPGMQYNPYAYAQHPYPHAQQIGWQQAPPYYQAGQQQLAPTSQAPPGTVAPPPAGDDSATTGSEEGDPESVDLAALANMQPDQLAKLLDANPEIRNIIIAAISKQSPEALMATPT